MNTLQMIANLDLNKLRKNYHEIPKKLKFEYYIVYKYANNLLCQMSNPEGFPEICRRLDKRWDEINDKLNDGNEKKTPEINSSLQEFQELLANNDDVLVDYYIKLYIFQNRRVSQNQPVTQPTKLLR